MPFMLPRTQEIYILQKERLATKQTQQLDSQEETEEEEEDQEMDDMFLLDPLAEEDP
jgi:hypothetical protein